jgi:protein SCO1/2
LAVPQRAEEGVEGLKRLAPATITALAVSLVLSVAIPVLAHQPGRDARLPTIGPAPPFALTTADGGRLALADLRGKVVAVTFIYATCTDTCPLLTAKLARLSQRMGQDLGAKAAFVAITVDPERDTPDVLRSYAQTHGARRAGWAFLTGTPAEIKEVAQRYGVFARRTDRGDVDHTFLTSLVDRTGVLRVQYMGVRFDPDEMLRDLRSLLREGGG